MTKNKIKIRKMTFNDVEIIAKVFCFPWSSTKETNAKWIFYAAEHEEKVRTVFLVESESELLGYGSLLRYSSYPHFKNHQIPEIHDVWISENYRKQGYGKKLIQHIERAAKKEGHKTIGLGVGLYRDYGPAQSLYISLGYTPDGNGITYQDFPVIAGQSYPVDDELILWLVKKL